MTSRIFYAVALAVIVLDQIVKTWVRSALPLHGTIPLWPGVFHLTYTQNEGMAFSLLQGQRWLLSAVALIVAGAIVVAQRRLGPKMPAILGLSLALPLGGAIGNLIDRIHLGYVVDLFDFTLINFPVFNVADSAITVGIGLLFWRTLTTKDEESASASPEKNAVPTEGASG